nr:ATP-dependent helicase [Actinomycetota bacterium]
RPGAPAGVLAELLTAPDAHAHLGKTPTGAVVVVVAGGQRGEVPLAGAVVELVALRGRGGLSSTVQGLVEAAVQAVRAVADGDVEPLEDSTVPASGWRAADRRVDQPVHAFVDAFITGGPAPGGGAPLVEVELVVDAAGAVTLSRSPVGGTAATLSVLHRARQLWAPVGRLLEAAGRTDVDDEELDQLTAGVLADLAQHGVAFQWPEAQRTRARAVLDRSGTGDLGLSWQLEVDGTVLGEEDLDALTSARGPVVRLKRGWVVLDPQDRPRTRRPNISTTTTTTAAAAVLTGTVTTGGHDVDLAPSAAGSELREALASLPTVLVPDGLALDLRRYQFHGLRWLARNTDLGLGVCLADDMGLGKTLTTIALYLHRAAAGHHEPSLVICPASVLGSWEREIRRAAPRLRVRRHHGPARHLPTDDAEADVVLTTYATLRVDADVLVSRRWGMVVADEAQQVKNHRTTAAKALRALPTGARVALTGTPVENRLEDLWSILDWTTPGLLGTRTSFRCRYATPITEGDQVAAERLARLVAPFVLRRRKSDPGIVPELPPKTVTDVTVGLSNEQAGLYRALVRDLLPSVEAAASDMARRGAVVRLLTGLKQICNHPAQFLHQQRTGPAGRSGKLDALDDILDVVVGEGASALVFTQYVVMGRLLLDHLRRRGTGARLLHGGTPVPERERLVADFQAGQVPVLLLSLHAAGTGLTLTRAEHVIHYDRWWNPAVEDQATDRAYRIGQTHPVQVHRLTTEATIEERISRLLEDKRDLATSILDSAGSENALTELSTHELARMVRLGPR